MEDTLREKTKMDKKEFMFSLNPCFNGRYSQRLGTLSPTKTFTTVLILVLMEDTLRGSIKRES